MLDVLGGIDGRRALPRDAGHASWGRGTAVPGRPELRILPRLYRARARLRRQGRSIGDLSAGRHSRSAWLPFRARRNGNVCSADRVGLVGQRASAAPPPRWRRSCRRGDIAMSTTSRFHHRSLAHQRRATFSAWAMSIVFAAIAAISFAVDQTVVSSLAVGGAWSAPRGAQPRSIDPIANRHGLRSLEPRRIDGCFSSRRRRLAS